MILSAQSIRNLKPIDPFYERTIKNGMSFGLGPNGYDIRIAEDIRLPGKGYTLASSIEYFKIPTTIMARVVDKSTWARRFLSVFNTTIDAGWNGYLTLELVNHSDKAIYIESGSPIAKIIFERLDEETMLAYNGAYQNQSNRPVEPAVQHHLPGLDEGPLFLPRKTIHAVRQENDEYACMCGMRWDAVDGENHP